MSALLRYDFACRAVAEALTCDEVREWEDKAAAVREYARRIDNRKLEIDALEIRERARRRRGELILQLKAEGILYLGQKEMSESSDISRLTLPQLNTTRDQSSRDQKLAKMEPNAFERLIARCRAYMEENPEKHAFDNIKGDDKKARRAAREAELADKILALPEKRYAVILADPEWRFEPYSRETGMGRAAENHYPTSTTDKIAARPVAQIAADDCVLFLWATVPMLPDALRVMAAWDFEYKSHIIWNKQKIGTGYWFRNTHELLLVGTRGHVPAPAQGTQWPSLKEAQAGRHSEKPDWQYELIESYFPKLPKIELNARRRRKGWEAWGLDAPSHDPETGEVMEAAE